MEAGPRSDPERGASPWLLASCVVLFTALSFSHAWNAWSRAAFSTDPFLHGDALSYVELMRSGDPSAVDPPYRYRPLTPWLARQVPEPPAWMLTRPRPLSVDEMAVMRFALANAVGLSVAAAFLFLLLGRFGFGPWERLAGSLLLLVSHLPSGVAMNPLVDAWGYGLLTAGLWGLLARRWVVVALSFGLGLFNNEAIALVPLAALLLRGWSPRDRWILAASFVPLTALYLWFRLFAFPAAEMLNPPGWYSDWAGRLLATPEILAIPKDLLASFGVLWIPAIFGWNLVARGSALSRWRPIVPLVLLVPLVLIKGPARTWFYMFPILIPLALLGVRSWLRKWESRS